MSMSSAMAHAHKRLTGAKACLVGKSFITMGHDTPCYRRDQMARLVQLAKEEEGATAIEYGLIAALIAVAAIVAMGAVGSALDTTFSGVADSIGSTQQ
jgi:pilus assembly protein Flp/PilA